MKNFQERAEDKMTPRERKLHEKQAETAAEFWAEGARYVRDTEKETGGEVRYAPRLEITDEQYERIAKEMEAALQARKLEDEEFREGLDKFLADLLASSRPRREERRVGDSPEQPIPARVYSDMLKSREMHVRGFVETFIASTDTPTVEYRDTHRAVIEGAPDLLLDVEGLLAEHGTTAEDIVSYDALLMVRSARSTRTIELGSIQFTGRLAELDEMHRAFVGDMFFALWRNQIEHIASGLGDERGGAFDQAIAHARQAIAPAIRIIAEDALRIQRGEMF
jgi:hypothetical protein